jgi:hypothetical protein
VKSKINILPLLLIVLMMFALPLNAQKKPRIQNLPKFERRPYHFGFLLAVNQMNFAIKTVDDYKQFDSLVYVTSQPSYGFCIGIVSQLRIMNHLTLRFVPTLSFGDRSMEYTIKSGNTVNLVQSKHVESTFMEFPLLVKYTSKRLVNAQAYIIGGFKYTIDMASQAKKKNKEFDIPIKLYKSDFCGEIGTGFDFYLTYFKFGIELKMSYGLLDLLQREGNIYTNPIKRLGSKVFQLSFTFEG